MIHGFALLETMLWEPGAGYFLLERHLQRLRGSARHFAIPLDASRVRGDLEALAGGFGEPRVVRLTVDAAGVPRVAVRVPSSHRAARIAIVGPPVRSTDPKLAHKTTDRETYTKRERARPECDTVLMVNERAELTEATIANLVVVLDGERLTPPRRAGLLPGVFREHLLDEGAIRERTLRPAMLASAESVYLINSVRRWWPVHRVEPIDPGAFSAPRG